MVRDRKNKNGPKGQIGDYRHDEAKRKNNPEVGLANWEAKGKTAPKVKYDYDPFKDPQLQWSGKAERLSFDVNEMFCLDARTRRNLTIPEFICD